VAIINDRPVERQPSSKNSKCIFARCDDCNQVRAHHTQDLLANKIRRLVSS